MGERRRKKSSRGRSGRRLSRKTLLLGGGALALVVLVVANIWVFRRQFPSGRALADRRIAAARAEFERGNDAAALEAAQRAFDETPDDNRVRYVLALALERAGRSGEARELLETRIAKDLEDDEGRVLLAAIARREEDYATALELLTEAIGREPTPGAAWRLIAEIRALTGDRDGAAQAYREATARDDDDLRGWLAFGDLQLSVFLDTASRVAQGDAVRAYEAAERLARRRLASGPDELGGLALAKSLAGLTRAARDRTVAEATAALETIVAESGDVPGPTLVLAEFQRGFGDIAAARDTLEAALRRWETPGVRISLHRLLVEQGENADARAILERGVEKHPAAVALPLELATYHIGRGELPAAEDVLTAAESAFPEEPRVHEARGDVARTLARNAEDEGRLGDVRALRDRARAAYERALALRPRSMPLRKKRIGELLESGLAAEDQLDAAELADARAYVSDVLAVNPGDADALAWRARLLLLDGRPADAFELLSNAAAGDAPTVDVLRLFGIACERTGRDERAADSYERVVAALTRRNDPFTRDDRAATAADWVNVARATLLTGRAELSARLAADGVAAWPKSLFLHLLRAQALLSQDDAPQALVALGRAQDAFPDAPEPRILAASVLESVGRSAEAETLLRDTVSALDDEASRLALADFLGRSDRGDEAEEQIALVLRETAGPGPVLMRLGALRLATDPPRVDGARDAYRRAADAMSDAAPALARIADLELLVAGRDANALDAAVAAIDAYRAAAGEDRTLDYLEGKRALLEGRPDEAVTLLERHVAEGLPSRAALYYFAKALRQAGRPRDAEEPLVRAQNTAPGDTALAAELEALRADLGVDALSRGDLGGAVLAFSAVGQMGDRPTALLLAGARAGLYELGRAEEHAREHLRRSRGDRAGRHVLAAILLRRSGSERLTESIDLLRGLVADDASDAHAQAALGTALRAHGDLGEAVVAFRAAWEASDGAAGPAIGLASCLDELGRATEAIAFLEEAAVRAPEATDLGLLRGDLVLRSGDAAAASTVYLSVAAVAPRDERPVVGAAAALAASGDVEAARTLLSERLPALERPQRAWLALADLELRAGRLVEASDALENARDGTLETPHGVLLRGQLAEAEGNEALARRLYTSGVERGARSTGTLRRLGHLLTRVGEDRLARDAYEKLLRIEPDDVVGLNNLALLLGDDARTRARGITLARRARELDSENGAVADTLGWLLLEDARPEEAIPHLRVAAAAAPEDAVVRFHAGLAAARLAIVDEAREHFEAALAADPDFPGADAARSQLDRLR